ncbi:ROK family protein [Candidatus Saccharibacteria bacterium]|nr:ROK family protein [Candidatus Saccharibacteria bacterium]
MYLTIDVGGTKTLLATFSEAGEIIERFKFPTPKSYVDFIAELKVSVENICGGETPVSCSMALPASIDREKGIAEYFGNLDWSNVPIADDLKDTLKCPLYLENDAKLAGLAEAYELKDKYKRVLYVTVSTGIGLGLVVDGKIDYSVHDAGGRGMLMEHDGKLMAWEEFASGKAIVAQIGKIASEITDEKDWYFVARNIAVGLIDLIVTLSPEAIVIGGGVGGHLHKFKSHLDAELEIYRSKMITKLPEITEAKHPEEAVVYGGYLLCKQHESTRTS